MAKLCSVPCWLVFGMIISALVAVFGGLTYVITNPVFEQYFSFNFVISSNVRPASRAVGAPSMLDR